VVYPLTFNTVGLTAGATYTGTITFTGCTNNGNPCTTTATLPNYTTVVNVSLTTTANPSIYGLVNPTNQTPSSPISSSNGIVLTGQVGQTTICTNTIGQTQNNPTFFTTGGTLGAATYSVNTGANFITWPISGGNNPITGLLNGNSNGGVLPTSLATYTLGGAGAAQVCVNPQLVGNAPGTYLGSVAVSVPGAANSPFIVPVTLILGNTPGKIELSNTGVYRNGVWFENLNKTTYQYSLGNLVTPSPAFGLPGDQPVAGDWTGTGVVRVGVFRQGAWYLDLNNNGTFEANEGPFFFGLPGDIAVVGDWTGTGSSKVGVFRAGTWYLNTQSFTAAQLVPGFNMYSAAATLVYSFGFATDTPVVGTWGTGTNVDRIGVYRCTGITGANCTWIVDVPGTGVFSPTADGIYTNFGITGDIPVVGDWFGTGGPKKIGVYRPSNNTFYLDVNGTNTAAPNDIQAPFGLPGDLPVIGNWGN
jgi:hypothetical protein